VASLNVDSLTAEPEGESFVERRVKRRKRVQLPAKIAFGASAADCMIRDLTDSGARIHAPTVLGLPDQVFLLIVSEGLVVRTRRVWADFPAFGLRFLEVEPIEKSTRPETAPLRLAWEELRARAKEPVA
jgi:hypothetical protein